MREGLINAVKKVADEELAETMFRFPLFNSPHEGISILREELEESHESMDSLNEAFDEAWKKIKENEFHHVSTIQIYAIYREAIDTACEAIRVAAMAMKYMESPKCR